MAQNPHLVVYEGSRARRRQAHRAPRRRSRVPLARNRCRRWRGSWRSTTDSSAASSSRPIRRPGFIEPGSSNISGLEALKTRRPAGRVPALPGFSRRRDAAHRRLSGSRRAGRRLPHGDARVSDQAARREVPEVRLGTTRRGLSPAASAGRFSARRGCRTTARNHKQSSRLLLQADQAAIRSCAASRTSGCSRAATRPIRSPAARSSRSGRSSMA